jgi:undecaprenyl diphosphate synthase
LKAKKNGVLPFENPEKINKGMSFKDKIAAEKIPEHVAVIMDGNGRWAKKRGNQRIFGHRNAVQAVRETVEAAGELQIKYLTLYAFSTENWNRPQQEVNALMSLLVSSIEKETPNLMKNNVRLQVIGENQRLPADVQNGLSKLILQTSKNTGLTVILALSYSSRREIEEAVKKIARDCKSGIIEPEKIDQNLIQSYLYTTTYPDPELMIRTSGEYRISNFLLWQMAYTELYFTNILWPDFRKEDFFEAVFEYQKRERRFGKTEDQIH